MMNIRTAANKQAAEVSLRGLSPVAYEFYSGADPLEVYEYDTEAGKRYSFEGAFGSGEDLTFEELQEIFESLAAEIG